MLPMHDSSDSEVNSPLEQWVTPSQNHLGLDMLASAGHLEAPSDSYELQTRTPFQPPISKNLPHLLISGVTYLVGIVR